jgi:hypothetical protein
MKDLNMAYGNLYGGPTTQHEGYAVTGKAPQDEIFDVLPHNHKNRPNSESKIGRKRELRDGERGIKPGIKYHPNRLPMQAAPDHGDHSE